MDNLNHSSPIFQDAKISLDFYNLIYRNKTLGYFKKYAEKVWETTYMTYKEKHIREKGFIGYFYKIKSLDNSLKFIQYI